MPKRLYIAPVVTIDRGGEPVRTSAIAAALSAGTVAGTVQQVIAPDRDWCLVLADLVDHRPIEQDNRLHPLPVFPFDGKLSAMHKPTLDRLNTRLQALGFDTAAWAGSEGFRVLVRDVGRRLEPAFDEQHYNPS